MLSVLQSVAIKGFERMIILVPGESPPMRQLPVGKERLAPLARMILLAPFATLAALCCTEWRYNATPRGRHIVTPGRGIHSASSRIGKPTGTDLWHQPSLSRFAENIPCSVHNEIGNRVETRNCLALASVSARTQVRKLPSQNRLTPVCDRFEHMKTVSNLFRINYL